VSVSIQHELVERIHAAGRQCVVSVTGGGSRAIADLLTVPGASASVLEAVVPYAPAALDEWLGGPVDQACSEHAARAMAMAGFERARRFSDADPRAICGIGATASLATTRTKRGPHRVHVAWQSAQATVTYSCELAKAARNRDDEETLAGGLVLHAVAEACGVTVEAPLAPSPSEPITRREKRAPDAWTELLLGHRTQVGEPASAGGQSAAPQFRDHAKLTKPLVVFPGAFNPFHAGHRRMAQIAAVRCGGPVTCELSIKNVDKRAIDFLEIDDRLQQLADYPVLLTRAATFAEKAALVPGAVFVVGADTLRRIGELRYYGGSAERRNAAVAAITDLGCRFLVFGRTVDGRFSTLATLANLPTTLRRLCDEVPENEFRDDVSSSELRRTD
jgi:nicotinamide mononucleotide (NMN) deamidase PncC